MPGKDWDHLLDGLSEADISLLTEHLLSRRVERVLAGEDDMSEMANNAVSAMFSQSNNNALPRLFPNGIVAIANFTQAQSGKRHVCANCTVTIGEQSGWSWSEDLPTFLAGSGATRIGGATRSVALHSAVPGMRITRHFMHHDGERHTRNRDECFVVNQVGEDESGEPVFSIVRDSEYVTGRLPLPAGLREDSRDSEGQ